MADYASGDITFIASLLPRVGYWVSHAEDTDVDDHSEELEQRRMVKALERVAAKSASATIAQAAQFALKNTKPPENETEDTLGGDLRTAVEIFTDQNDQDTLTQFKKAVMYIGTCVARAYREELDHHEDEFLLENLMSRLSGYLNRESDPEEFKDQNISPAEDSALTFILESLKGK